MEGINDIFFAGDGAQKILHAQKKYFMTFIWGNPFSTHGSLDRFFGPSRISPYVHLYAFRVPPSFVYVISSI